MGRKLRYVLVFLLIILKEPNMPEAGCKSKCESASVCGCDKMGLTSIPQDLPTNISCLELFYNKIKTLNGSELTRYRDLTKLHLNYNQITTIQFSAVSKVSELTVLSIGGNRLTNIQPGVFSNVPKLTFLYLSANLITNIQPGAFSNIPNLLELILCHNLIDNIQPGAFSNLPNFERLQLCSNKINNIQPGLFSDLPKLKVLNLASNRITNIQLSVFSNLPKLWELSLNSNQIANIQPATVSNPPQLVILRLDENNINDIQDNTFLNLPKLKYLYLRSNNITSIQPRQFANLTELNLQSNQIAVLPLSAHRILSSISLLHIGNNPWQCDCKMAPFRLQMNGHPMRSFEDQIVCHTPAMFAGQKLKDIDPTALICKVAPTPTMAPPTKLSFVSSKISIVPVDGRFEIGNSSNNGKIHHTSNYKWCFKRNPGSKARPVYAGSTFIPLPVDQREQESNSSHESAPSFPLPVLIASVSGLVAGIVLIGGIILTMWYKRRAKNPPSGQNPTTVLDDRVTQIKIPLAALQPNRLDRDAETLRNRHQTSEGAGSTKGLNDVDLTSSVTNTNTNTTTCTATVVTIHYRDHQYEDIDTSTQHTQTDQKTTESNINIPATVVTSGRGQTGQGQSQAVTANSMYFGVETLPKGPITSTQMSSSEDQTRQGIDHPIYESNTAPKVTRCSDQTVQGKSQATTDESLDGTNLIYNTESAALESNSLYESRNDQTGQGQPQVTSDASSDGRNVVYNTGPEASEPNPVYTGSNKAGKNSVYHIW
ncbi:nyctalopin-like [Branchiostoma floridae]|uniref:Nyctalopin-like n=1 Tax=Branchiostoma floridae TaxID=7739 RepID=A0A9J7N537_BRAFL|nr:nyctalopin-like [Branchiostoma floridae]